MGRQLQPESREDVSLRHAAARGTETSVEIPKREPRNENPETRIPKQRSGNKAKIDSQEPGSEDQDPRSKIHTQTRESKHQAPKSGIRQPEPRTGDEDPAIESQGPAVGILVCSGVLGRRRVTLATTARSSRPSQRRGDCVGRKLGSSPATNRRPFFGRTPPNTIVGSI